MARLHKSATEVSPLVSLQLSSAADPAVSPASQAPSVPPSSAVHGASLLNAARVGKPASGALKTDVGKGKLPRPSLVPARTRKQLAPRTDLYDIPDSPVKGTFQLPETVNPAPLRLLRKKKKPKRDTEAQSEIHSEQQELQPRPPTRADDEEEQLLPIFPLTTAEGPDHSVDIDQHEPDDREGIVKSKSDRATTISKSPIIQDPILSETSNSEQSSRPVEQGHDGKSSRKSHPEIRIPVRQTKKGASSSIADAEGERSDNGQHESDGDTIAIARSRSSATSNHQKSKPQVSTGIEPTSSRSQSTGGQTDPTPTSHNGDERSQMQANDTLESGHGKAPNSQQEPELNQLNGKPSKLKHIATPISSQSGAPRKKKLGRGLATKARTQPPQETTDDAPVWTGDDDNERQAGDNQVSDNEFELDRSPAEEREPDPPEQVVAHEEQVHANEYEAPEEPPEEDADLTDLERVFDFLDLEERSGECRTTLAKTIKRACDESCTSIGEVDSLDVVAEDANGIRATLQKVDSVATSRRSVFKSDAYAYLFRALTLYLETVYSWLREKCDEITESLEAFIILHPLTNDILIFKDRMTTWDVSVPQRYKGDRLVSDVESKLILPLRKVEQAFRARKTILETELRNQQRRLDLKRKREEEIARQDHLAARKERRKRWQDLHVARMLCEPVPFRQKLFFTEIDDLEETDANGVKFERIPLFKDRVTPRTTGSGSGLKEWTDEQTVVLTQALEKFAGPFVFEKLFDAHCRPGGVLSDFTVMDITTQAAWVRSAYLKLHQAQQDKGWEVPDWIKQIPVLP